MSLSVDVRIARPDECGALSSAFGDEWYFRDRLVRQELGHGELFVAWVGPTPVGTVYLWREQPFEPTVRERLGWTPTINHLEVRSGWRGRGIGTALVKAVERFATVLGYWRIGLGVGVDNPDARRLYERLGYTDWGHGLVESVWHEPDGDGFKQLSLTCHWMVRTLPIDAPAVDDWDAWSPEEAYQRLKGSTVDWYVAGGWALDLWLGRQSRPHEDLEVAIDRTDFPAWRAYLSTHECYDVGTGRVRRLGPGDRPDPRHHQIWLRDVTEPVWRLDTFLEERPDGRWSSHWVSSQRYPMEFAVRRTATGIPYLRPELVLLGKAKHRRPKDEADLSIVLPGLDGESRARLRAGLRAADEGHPWLAIAG